MIRTIQSAENCVFVDPPRVVTVPAATATELLPNEKGINTGEIAYRYIQNIGAGTLYFSIGVGTDDNPSLPVCDANLNTHGYLAPGQQLDCSGHRLRVCGYSVDETLVATLVVRRRDQSK